MKIATVIYNSPLGKWLNSGISHWLHAARKFYDEDDLVFITDKPSDWKGKVPNLVEAEPLDFKPTFGKQHVVVSNFYRAQAYRLVQEPVTFLDLDCLLQDRLPEWDDDIFRCLTQRKGTHKKYLVDGQVIDHYCAAVQYQGADYLDEWKAAFEITRSKMQGKQQRSIGEAATSWVATKMEKFECLPIKYGWPSFVEPYPKDIKILHYMTPIGKRMLRKLKRRK